MQKIRYVAVFVVFSASVCAAELRPYTGFDIGGAFTKVESSRSETGIGIEGAVGLAFKPDNLFENCLGGRVELAIASQYNRVEDLGTGGPATESDGDLFISTFFVNGYLDLYSDQRFNVYLLGGVGNASIHYEDDNFIFEDTSYAVQIGAGVAYEVTDHVAIDLRYKYMKTTPSAEDVKLDIRSSFVGIGARFTF